MLIFFQILRFVMQSNVNFFEAAGNGKMKCKLCGFITKYESSHQHTTNLRVHLTTKHPEQLTPELLFDIVEDPIFQWSYNCGKKVAISEACEERAFSKHKRVHTNLRATLKAEKLDDRLFIRYNVENILKISKELVQVEDDIIDLGYHFEPFDNDFD